MCLTSKMHLALSSEHVQPHHAPQSLDSEVKSCRRTRCHLRCPLSGLTLPSGLAPFAPCHPETRECARVTEPELATLHASFIFNHLHSILSKGLLHSRATFTCNVHAPLLHATLRQGSVLVFLSNSGCMLSYVVSHIYECGILSTYNR